MSAHQAMVGTPSFLVHKHHQQNSSIFRRGIGTYQKTDHGQLKLPRNTTPYQTSHISRKHKFLFDSYVKELYEPTVASRLTRCEKQYYTNRIVRIFVTSRKRESSSVVYFFFGLLSASIFFSRFLACLLIISSCPNRF